MDSSGQKDYTAELEQKIDNMGADLPGKKDWWWIIGEVMKKGKSHTVFYGPEVDEDSAHRRGYEVFKGYDFKVKMYPTRDEAEATRMWKAEKAREVGAVEALDRVRHRGRDIGIERPKRGKYGS